MIGSALDSAGCRTGFFRSPHLETYRERIAMGSRMIDETSWESTFERILPLARSMESGTAPDYDLGRPSLFEVIWAMGALFFAERGVEVAAVEVGMGGRLDPTNILEPEVAVVTNVSLDHTRVLGTTETEIAREKAAIIKPGAAAATAVTQPDVLQVVVNRSRDVGGSLGGRIRREVLGPQSRRCW